MNFYPGPSKLFRSVEKHLQEAYQSGLLSQNHRSPAFAILLEECISKLKAKLDIPPEYEIVFTSSATECWEIIAQSFTKTESYHIFNGAFGEKWYQSTQKITKKASAFSFEIEEKLPVDSLTVSDETDLICITQNETSNGTQIRENELSALQNKFTEPLIAVDATSSMGGTYLNFNKADIWFASVQKCFGLPAGLAILAFSPKAIEQGLAINENNHYNSFVKLHENALKFQTAYTPNGLGIFLLKKQLETMESIYLTACESMDRRIQWYDFLNSLKTIKPLVQNIETCSDTVIAILPKNVNDLLKKAKEQGITLGKGYGKWKDSTIRIANFMAINEEEIEQLQKFLRDYEN